jgi:CheY-like chemotaxis protein
MAKILFVDDSRESADALAALLKLLGHETEVAYDGERAVEVAARFAPDISFIDLQMPMMDGYEAAGEFRARLGRDAILIALTAQDWDRARGKAAVAGFDGFLQKPASAEDIVAMVDALPAALRASRPPA